MDKKSIVIAVVLVGVIALVGGMVWSAEKDKLKGKGQDKTQVVAMARTAEITIEQAIKTAVENFPGKVIEAELKKRDGKASWEIEIVTAEQNIMVVYVDAESGSVITTEEKMAGKKQEREQTR